LYSVRQLMAFTLLSEFEVKIKTVSMGDFAYIIDVFSLVFQVFHAIPSMTGPSGQPTNATYGFTRDLLAMLCHKKPTYLLCAMDSAGPGVRNDIYADYKANREAMPDELRPQIPMIVEVMKAFRLPIVEQAGWEADDVMATIARLAKERDIDVQIVTNDKDARQLIGPRIQLYNIRKNFILGEEYLLQDWGIRPDQVVDFQALVGDSVDNVPGVPLVGPKKARVLLNQFDTLDNVLAHADEASGPKLRENLKIYADQARMSRELVRLKTDLPLEIDWDAARTAQPDIQRLLELFRMFGFHRFADEVRQLAPEIPTVRRQQSVEVIDTNQKLKQFLSSLNKQRTFCMQLQTTSLDAMRADIVGCAFNWQPNSGYYIAIRGPAGQATLDTQKVLDSLRPILEDANLQITSQNIKYALVVLRRFGIHICGLGVDPMVGSYLLSAGARTHSLDALSEQYLKFRPSPSDEITNTNEEHSGMPEICVAKIAVLAGEDVDATRQVANLVADELRRENLWDLYWHLERRLISVLARMQCTGIRIDVEELNRQSSDLGKRLSQLVADIHESAGREFNIDSPLQLRTVLFEDLNLPVLKKTKTGASTSQDVLERLAEWHPLPRQIIEHRHLAKLKRTYLDALPEMVNPQTGKVHTSFNQVVTATGRLSSSNPNLQNIPIRTDEGRRVRRAFVPSQQDWKLVCADYSQIELRMLAHFSQDKVLVEAFHQGADIHLAVAAEIFDVDADRVTLEMRRVAKTVNFGVIYGQTPFGLSAALGITTEQAAEFIDNYFTLYSGVDRFLEQSLDECERSGFAQTILGRRRVISGIRPRRGRQRNLPERTAVNTIIQGSAADLIKQAMVNIDERIERESHPGQMLLQIHDELVFEVPVEQTDSLVKLVRDEMQTAMNLIVPVTVDVSVGSNWLDLENV